jgi:tRNA (guanine-N7-)-methyltransferase
VDERRLRTYGRVKGRALKPRQARLIATLLPTLAIPEGPVDLDALAPGAHGVWLEAGFGGGEHLVGQAARRPEALFLGAEPFLNGVAACLSHIEDRRLTNVRLHAGDVRALMARLPDASLGRIIVLFPDPWPKARHKKRRLIEPAFVAEAARLMEAGGRLRIATDWADYAHWILQRVAASSAFRWTAERASDWREPPRDHISTRYEAKRLGDCAPIWLEFERV